MSDEDFSIDKILQDDPAVKANPELLDKVMAVFDFTQYLLDDDDNLTKSANLNSKARSRLDERIEEIYLGAVDE